MKRRMVGSAVVAVGVALLTTGCGAGLVTQTDTQVAAINGTRAEVGDIAIRNAELAYPESGDPALYRAGSDAGVTMWVVNQGLQPDQLVSARSGAASNVLIEGSRTVPAQGQLVLTPGDPGRATEPQNNGSLTLQTLSRPVWPGQLTKITLTFRDAGSVTFEMPVTVPAEPRVPSPEEPVEGGH